MMERTTTEALQRGKLHTMLESKLNLMLTMKKNPVFPVMFFLGETLPTQL